MRDGFRNSSFRNVRFAGLYKDRHNYLFESGRRWITFRFHLYTCSSSILGSLMYSLFSWHSSRATLERLDDIVLLEREDVLMTRGRERRWWWSWSWRRCERDEREGRWKGANSRTWRMNPGRYKVLALFPVTATCGSRSWSSKCEYMYGRKGCYLKSGIKRSSSWADRGERETGCQGNSNFLLLSLLSISRTILFRSLLEGSWSIT